MAIDHGHGGDSGHNPSVGYDKTDLSAKGILIFFVVLAVFAVAMHLGALGLYVGMTKIADQHEAESSPLAPQTYKPRDGILTNTANVNVKQFPDPRLLPHVRGGPGEMTNFLMDEAAALTAQPWQDPQGNVHLPIAEAMKVLLPRLPVRAGSTELPNYPGAKQQVAYPAPDEDVTETGASAQRDSEQNRSVKGETGEALPVGQSTIQ
jgi:hypothetical protein